jgi:hypothetical protein
MVGHEGTVDNSDFKLCTKVLSLRTPHKVFYWNANATTSYSWSLSLTFFTPIRITLMLRHEAPRLRSRTQKHFGNLHPILAVRTRK